MNAFCPTSTMNKHSDCMYSETSGAFNLCILQLVPGERGVVKVVGTMMDTDMHMEKSEDIC